jgi:hypothetical protein
VNDPLPASELQTPFIVVFVPVPDKLRKVSSISCKEKLPVAGLMVPDISMGASENGGQSVEATNSMSFWVMVNGQLPLTGPEKERSQLPVRVIMVLAPVKEPPPPGPLHDPVIVLFVATPVMNSGPPDIVKVPVKGLIVPAMVNAPANSGQRGTIAWRLEPLCVMLNVQLPDNDPAKLMTQVPVVLTADGVGETVGVLVWVTIGDGVVVDMVVEVLVEVGVRVGGWVGTMVAAGVSVRVGVAVIVGAGVAIGVSVG